MVLPVMPCVVRRQDRALHPRQREALRVAGALVFAPLARDHAGVRRLGLTPVTWNPVADVDSVGLAAELAEIGLSVTARAIREAVARLPRP